MILLSCDVSLSLSINQNMLVSLLDFSVSKAVFLPLQRTLCCSHYCPCYDMSCGSVYRFKHATEILVVTLNSDSLWKETYIIPVLVRSVKPWFVTVYQYIMINWLDIYPWAYIRSLHWYLNYRHRLKRIMGYTSPMWPLLHLLPIRRVYPGSCCSLALIYQVLVQWLW